MTELAASLVELARRHGVATDYDDWTGGRRAVAESTLVAVLAALGVAAGSEDERLAALLTHDREHWRATLAPTVVARAPVIGPCESAAPYGVMPSPAPPPLRTSPATLW